MVSKSLTQNSLEFGNLPVNITIVIFFNLCFNSVLFFTRREATAIAINKVTCKGLFYRPFTRVWAKEF